MVKKEIIFPPDSVEATTPVLYRRKRLCKADVCPVDPWRIFMAMRSGLLTECTWALDVLNVLLFDDTTVQYFGLAHLPGLLTLLLEHFQKSLAEMFSDGEDGEETRFKNTRCVRSICSYNRRRHYENNDEKSLKVAGGTDVDSDVDEGIDLGQVRAPPSGEERVLLLSHTPNYTMLSRKGLPVRMQAAEEDIFVIEAQKAWDVDTDKLYEQTIPIGSNAWTFGFTERDPYDGIIDVFKSEIIDIPFARFIRGKGRREANKAQPQTQAKTEHSVAEDGLAGACSGKKPEENDENHTAVVDEEGQLQQTFNKKRRLFNNSNKCVSHASDSSSSNNPKKLKLHDSSDNGEVAATAKSATFACPEVKKEPTTADAEAPATAALTSAPTSTTIPGPATDSDCREVDMEIEAPHRLQNGVKNTDASSPGCFDPKATVRDPALVLQRRRDSSYEDECYTRDEASLYLVNESQDSLARRCICLSNIFRNLTFVPGNETILAKSTRFLAILGRLLLLNHEHLQRTPKTRNYDREEDTDFSDSCSSLMGEREWWWEYLISIRENMLVAMANIAGHLELARYEEIIARPLIDGLLHWAVCPSAHGQDPFPSCGSLSALSPQRLALEALCKLCVTDANVDLVIATPPHSRLEKLCAVLTRHLCRNEDQVLREFSVNLLHYLAAADSAMARTVALQSPCISYLVAFIEQAEQTALGVANQHGINYLRENPDSMGTSLDMLRRAAGTLLHLAKHADNRSLFMQQEQRLLGLVMSHILDQQVALIISRVLFQVSRGAGPMPSMEYRLQQRQQNDAGEKKQEIAVGVVASVNESVSAPAVKSEMKVEVETEATPSAALATGTAEAPAGHNSASNSNCSSASSNAHKTAASSLATATVDDNSNSSSQMPPAATLNDVSNSSTNSNSCSTASSSQSSNISNSSHVSSGGLVNNIAEMSAATTAAIAKAPTAMAATMNSDQHQGHHQLEQQQQHLISNKSVLNTTAAGTVTTAAAALSGNGSSNSSINSSINSNSNNSCSNSSNSNASSSISSVSVSPSAATTAAVTATTPPPPPPPATATPATTTAAVA